MAAKDVFFGDKARSRHARGSQYPRRRREGDAGP